MPFPNFWRSTTPFQAGSTNQEIHGSSASPTILSLDQELLPKTEEQDTLPRPNTTLSSEACTAISASTSDAGRHSSIAQNPSEDFQKEQEMEAATKMQDLPDPDPAAMIQEAEGSQAHGSIGIMQPDNPPYDNGATTTTTLDMQIQPHIGEGVLLTRYQPSDTIHTAQRRRPDDRSSAPPECLRGLRQQDNARRNNYLDRFSSDILPPPTAPLYMQLITYMQRWGVWAQFIKAEDFRQRVITAVADRIENVWLEGMRLGLIPQAFPASGDADNSAAADGNKLPGLASQSAVSAQQLALNIMGAAGRGRHVQQQQRKKRPVSPSKIVVLRARRTESRDFGITAGELEDAHITMDMINERVMSGDLDEDDEVMNDVLEQVDRDVLDGGDWYSVVPKTKNNSMGRDLMVYCLWEVQNSRNEIESLHYLMNRFNQHTQKRNTQARIDAEMELQNQFLALALILHDNDAETTNLSTSEGLGIAKETTRTMPAESHEAVEIRSSSSPVPSIKSRSDSDDGDINARTESDRQDPNVGDLHDNEVDGRSSVAPGKSVAGQIQGKRAEGSSQNVLLGTEDRTSVAKRSLEVEEVTGEHHSKKARLLDGHATNISAQVQEGALPGGSHTPTDAARDSTPASASFSLSAPSVLEPQTRHFIDSAILPKVNELLRRAGHELIAEGTPWKVMKMRLRAAKVGSEVRNEVAQEIRTFQQSLLVRTAETPDSSSLAALELPDLPPREEIIKSIPAEGLTPQQFNEIFKSRVDPNDMRWPSLVRSVAYRDKVNGRWFVLSAPNVEEEPLRGATPESSAPMKGQDLHKSHGREFISSYFPSATSQARKIISTPTDELATSSSSLSSLPSRQLTPRIKLNIHKPELKIVLKSRKGFNPKDYSARVANHTKGFRWRYLKSSMIGERDSMDDVIATYVKDRVEFDREKKRAEGDPRSNMPDRFGRYEVLAHPNNPDNGIVHGIWDYRNKTKVQSAGWFYEGKDGEWVHPIIAYDEMGYSYIVNQAELDLQAGGEANTTKTRIHVIELDGALEEAEMGKDKGGKKGKSKAAKVKGRSIPPPPPPPSIKVTARKRKAETMEPERPKRRATQRARRYVFDDEDADEDYLPGGW